MGQYRRTRFQTMFKTKPFQKKNDNRLCLLSQDVIDNLQHDYYAEENQKTIAIYFSFHSYSLLSMETKPILPKYSSVWLCLDRSMFETSLKKTEPINNSSSTIVVITP